MLVSILVYLCCGAVAGVLAGLLGVGGGIVIVPMMVAVFPSQGIPAEYVQQIALGTSLASIMITSISSSRAHHKRGAVHWDIFRNITPGILLGTFLFCIQRELDALEAMMGSCPDFEVLCEKSLDYVSDLFETRATSYRLIALALRPGASQERCRAFAPGYCRRLQELLQRSLELGKRSRFVRQDCEYPYFAYVISSVYLAFANALLHQKDEMPPELSFLTGKDTLRAYTQSMLKSSLG